MAGIQVLVDGLVFENTYQIGIWRVFYEVMQRTSSSIEYTILLAKPPQQPIPLGVKLEPAWHRSATNSPDYSGRLIRRFRRLRANRRYSNAIWHSTFFSLDPRSESKSVVTVYDMIAERYFYSGSEWVNEQREQKRRAIDRSTCIISISQDAANDLRRFYPSTSIGAKKKVTVIPLGVEHLSMSSEPRHSIAKDPFVLYVGNRFAYKNFVILLEAVASDSWPINLKVKVVGTPFSAFELSFINCLGIADKIDHAGRLSDSELAEHYRLSHCFVFPSLMEGFGIPILEAQANGCVPIISEISVFREISGQGAIYFNPRDPESLCSAVKQAADSSHRQRILNAAQGNLKRFSWDVAADLVANVYSEIAG